jgi:hypothetical protein
MVVSETKMKDSQSRQARIVSPCVPGKAVEQPKRAYAAPVLRVYGSVRQLTLGSSGTRNDGGGTRRPRRRSDRSIKQNIRRVGTHPLGIGLYLFEYQPDYREEGGAGRQFGVMADEVESILPQAVGRDVRGYKTVDYAMLGISVPDVVSG